MYGVATMTQESIPAEFHRIMGTESENAVLESLNLYPGKGLKLHYSHASYKPIEVRPEFYEDYDGEMPVINGFLRTGGHRMYLEPAGGFAEFSTGESTSPLLIVRAEQWGDEYVHNLVGAMKKHSAYDYSRRPISRLAIKRTLGEHNSTCGMHQNYLGFREIDLVSGYGPLLSTHVIASNVWAGAGGVRLKRNNQSHEFVAGAKLSDVTRDYNISTTSGKPVINTRDEPHADRDLWQRIHVTSTDGNRWPWPQFMKLATTSLVLRLVENNIECSGLTIDQSEAHLVKAANVCSITGLVGSDEINARVQDLSVTLANGDRIHPLKIELKLVEKCEEMAKSHFITEEERYALCEWRSICEQMLEDASSANEHVEWIGKLCLGSDALDRRKSKGDFSYNWNAFELAWCNLDPVKSIAIKAWKRYGPQQEIMRRAAAARSLPTRADARSGAVTWARNNFDLPPTVIFDWAVIRAMKCKPVYMLDPYDANPIPWQDLLAESYKVDIDYEARIEYAITQYRESFLLEQQSLGVI